MHIREQRESCGLCFTYIKGIKGWIQIGCNFHPNFIQVWKVRYRKLFFACWDKKPARSVFWSKPFGQNYIHIQILTLSIYEILLILYVPFITGLINEHVGLVGICGLGGSSWATSGFFCENAFNGRFGRCVIWTSTLFSTFSWLDDS